MEISHSIENILNGIVIVLTVTDGSYVCEHNLTYGNVELLRQLYINLKK